MRNVAMGADVAKITHTIPLLSKPPVFANASQLKFLLTSTLPHLGECFCYSKPVWERWLNMLFIQ